MRLILIMLISFQAFAENLNDLTLKLNHHGELENIIDITNRNIGFYVEDIKEIPQFGSKLIEDHFSRIAKIVPENYQMLSAGVQAEALQPGMAVFRGPCSLHILLATG